MSALDMTAMMCVAFIAVLLTTSSMCRGVDALLLPHAFFLSAEMAEKIHAPLGDIVTDDVWL